MWAGGQFEFRSPIRVGDRVDAHVDDRRRDDQGGPHRPARVRDGAPRGALQRRDRPGPRRVPRHRLPRGAATGRRRAAAPARAPTGAAWQREIVPDDVLLFRYSALTFNGHRIHYDRQLRHRGRGLPGPDRARPADRHAAARPAAPAAAPRPTSRRFRFKAVRPTFDLNPFRVMRPAARRRQDGPPVGPGPRGLADDGRDRDAAADRHPNQWSHTCNP